MNKTQLFEAAKAAYDAAVTAKKADAELQQLKTAMDTAKAAWDAEEATKANIVTLEEITSVVTGAVEAIA